MSRQRSKRQSLASSPCISTPEDIDMEDNRSYIPKVSEVLQTEVTKELYEAIKEISSEVISEVKEGMENIIKDLLQASKKR